MAAPVIAVIAAGSMGAGIATRLTQSGCTVLTNLTGRSDDSRRRAAVAGMQDASFSQIVTQADFFLSILPPSDAISLADALSQNASERLRDRNKLLYVDCNAVNPDTVQKIGALFKGSDSPIGFLDAAIIGGPPSDGYNPTIYASGPPDLLQIFQSLSEYGLKITALPGGIGDASALKMSYAGITKGTTALLATMILAAQAASPATADALLRELQESQPAVVARITRAIPSMLPKAYRWVGEMEEISGFVEEKEI